MPPFYIQHWLLFTSVFSFCSIVKITYSIAPYPKFESDRNGMFLRCLGKCEKLKVDKDCPFECCVWYGSKSANCKHPAPDHKDSHEDEDPTDKQQNVKGTSKFVRRKKSENYPMTEKGTQTGKNLIKGKVHVKEERPRDPYEKQIEDKQKSGPHHRKSKNKNLIGKTVSSRRKNVPSKEESGGLKLGKGVSHKKGDNHTNENESSAELASDEASASDEELVEEMMQSNATDHKKLPPPTVKNSQLKVNDSKVEKKTTAANKTGNVSSKKGEKVTHENKTGSNGSLKGRKMDMQNKTGSNASKKVYIRNKTRNNSTQKVEKADARNKTGSNVSKKVEKVVPQNKTGGSASMKTEKTEPHNKTVDNGSKNGTKVDPKLQNKTGSNSSITTEKPETQNESERNVSKIEEKPDSQNKTGGNVSINLESTELQSKTGEGISGKEEKVDLQNKTDNISEKEEELDIQNKTGSNLSKNDTSDLQNETESNPSKNGEKPSVRNKIGDSNTKIEKKPRILNKTLSKDPENEDDQVDIQNKTGNNTSKKVEKPDLQNKTANSGRNLVAEKDPHVGHKDEQTHSQSHAEKFNEKEKEEVEKPKVEKILGKPTKHEHTKEINDDSEEAQTESPTVIATTSKRPNIRLSLVKGE